MKIYKTFTTAIACLLIIVISACEAESLDTTKKNVSPAPVISLAYKQNYQLNDQLQISVLDIKEDSRCPQGTTCIMPGRVIVEFAMANGAGKQQDRFQLILTPGQKELAQKQFNGSLIQLLDVQPSPEAGKKLLAQDYDVKIGYSRVN